jgi:hypothetical protein
MHRHLLVVRSPSSFFAGRQYPRRVIRARLCVRLDVAKENAKGVVGSFNEGALVHGSALSVFFGENQSQRGSTMDNLSQREMPFLALVKGPQEVPLEFIKACKSELEALNLCMNLAHLSDETIREKLGIDKGHFSRIRKGRGNFPPNKRVQLMEFCGNLAPIQYEAWRMGRELIERSKDVRIRELEQQLAQLKEAA